MRTSKDANVLDFLQDDRNAVLATNGSSGFPQLTPVWYLFEKDVLYVSAQTKTVKVRNLRRDPTVSVCVDGGRGDARYVVLRGQAELIEPGEQQMALRRRIIGHYHDDESQAEQYYMSTQDLVGVIIALRLERIVTAGFTQSDE